MYKVKKVYVGLLLNKFEDAVAEFFGAYMYHPFKHMFYLLYYITIVLSKNAILSVVFKKFKHRGGKQWLYI